LTAEAVHDQRLRWAAIGAFAIAIAGLVAIVARVAFVSIGQPFGTITDVALLIMTLGLAPVMVGCYEMGGRTPLLPARAALTTGLLSIAAWSLIQLTVIGSGVPFEYEAPATTAAALAAVLLILIGSWLVGAPLLAGTWLPRAHRVVGVVAGLGWIALGVGVLIGAVQPLTIVGWLGYRLVFPIWALLMALLFRRLRRG